MQNSVEDVLGIALVYKTDYDALDRELRALERKLEQERWEWRTADEAVKELRKELAECREALAESECRRRKAERGWGMVTPSFAELRDHCDHIEAELVAAQARVERFEAELAK